MKLVLKGADFSENNLGQVEVDFEPSSLTLDIESKYSRTFTSSETRALNILLDRLINSGIWDKIDCLLLPMFATTLAESVVDVKGNFSFSTPGAAYSIVSKKGIKRTATPSSYNSIPKINVSNSILTDYHSMCFSTETVGSGTISGSEETSGGLYTVSFGPLSATYGYNRIFGDNNAFVPGAYRGKGAYLSGDPNFANVIGTNIISNKNGVLSYSLSGQPAISAESFNNYVSPSGDVDFGLGCPVCKINGNIATHTVGAASFGKSLSDNEMVKYNQYLMDFLNNF